MAKLIKTYENGIEKFELVFKGETFDFSMLWCEGGRKSDKECFEFQVKEKFPELAHVRVVLNLIERLSWESDEYEILDILEQLEEWEREEKTLIEERAAITYYNILQYLASDEPDSVKLDRIAAIVDNELALSRQRAIAARIEAKVEPEEGQP